jgi:hypothetical protein
MRALVGGVIGAAALAGAVWMTAADATTRGYPGGPYQVYIYANDDRPEVDLYAFSVGQRAAAAEVENCMGRLVSDPHRIVADLRARLRNDDEHFSVVWIEGEGSDTHIGGCGASDDPEAEAEAEKGDDESEVDHQRSESLVVLRDVSAAQVRHLVHEIHGLSAQDRAAMTNALGLDQPARARR